MPHLGGMLIMDEGSPCFVPFSKAKKGRVSRMFAIQVLEDSEGSDGGKKPYLDALVGKGAVVPKAAGNMPGGMVNRNQKQWQTFPKSDGRSTTRAEGWSSLARLGGGQVCSAWATTNAEGCCRCRLGAVSRQVTRCSDGMSAEVVLVRRGRRLLLVGVVC
ncbi:hypothetical protein F0562_030872 [Nyssa sinensis]|uniref:Uncharacterized protein n=1 Tax=Nyssa sinensis TaxID=561372 RepID=A0A5J5AZU5_9ASTE|nr:hypothetical protein F0562_030872 [Nyssa sinensis]